jgi:cytoskeletal protein RodZ
MTDKTQSLGEYLRHERERRGITIEQLASATKIGVRLLHSLEADHYADLPAKPFIRGFVTSYARFIGLDPKETLIRFNDYIETRALDRPSRDSGHSGYAFERKENSRTILWIMIGAFLLLGGIGILIVKPTFKHKRGGSHAEKLKSAHPPSPSPSPSPSESMLPSGAPSPLVAAPAPAPVPVTAPSAKPSVAPIVVPSPSPLPSPAAPVPVPAPTPSPSPQVAPSPSPAPNASPTPNPKDPLNSGLNLKSTAIKHKVIFKALTGVSVRYKVDDRPITQLKVGKDKLLVLRAQFDIRIQVGRAESLEFSYNGRPYQSVKVGENANRTQGAVTLVFPPQAPETIQNPFPDSGDFVAQ